MADGNKYIGKQTLIDKITERVYFNRKNLTSSDNIQGAIKDVVVSLWNNIGEDIIIDNADYRVIRFFNNNDFTIRLLLKRSCNLTTVELLPPNLAMLATFDDIRYICYNLTNDGFAKKYTFNLTFNKLVSDSVFVVAGDAYFNQLHLFDNVGDSSGAFNYSSAGGSGNYNSAIINNTGFNVSGTVTEDSSFTTGGVLEFTFKGSLIGKL